jgi:hypothetical protein
VSNLVYIPVSFNPPKEREGNIVAMYKKLKREKNEWIYSKKLIHEGKFDECIDTLNNTDNNDKNNIITRHIGNN